MTCTSEYIFDSSLIAGIIISVGERTLCLITKVFFIDVNMTELNPLLLGIVYLVTIILGALKIFDWINKIRNKIKNKNG